MKKNLLRSCLLAASLVCIPAIKSQAQSLPVPAIHHELATLPQYNVFDWLDGEIRPDGAVLLRGEVTHPSTRSDAEARVRSVEGVTSVTNEIRVLPLSPTDNALRIALYRAIYNWNSPLFRYSTQVVPPVHIV